VRVILRPSRLSAHYVDPAYVLNLRGQDIPYNPLFHAYLFIGLERTVLFTESAKVDDEVASYLESLDVERREYNDLWTFLRRREWGEGKVGCFSCLWFL
jgi:Xaa-Pro aminopeptidase